MAVKRLREHEGDGEDQIKCLRTANYLILLSHGVKNGERKIEPAEHLAGRVFKCKTCNRQFGSFQALGGHSASHKKPRMIDNIYRQTAPLKPKVHQCPICGIGFPIGQALGGHMRRHRSACEDLAVDPMTKKSDDDNKMKESYFDLNVLPPSEEEALELFLKLELAPKMYAVAC